MPVATLRHYSVALTTTGSTSVVSAVATARALAISKITVAASGSSTITVVVGGQPIVSGLSLTAGQVYTETGLVLLTTETVTVTAGTPNVLVVSVFGEEIDN